MKRKVIQIADSTQLVSLPRKWAQKHNIKKGDELDIKEEGSNLTITTPKGIEMKKISLDVSNLNPHLVRWSLFAVHKSGYDEVEIKFTDPKILEIIQSTIQEGLMGYAIIEQSGNRCLVRNLSQDLESEFDPTLRRVFLVIQSMAESSFEAIKNNNFEKLKDIKVLEVTVNKLTNFCERILNTKGFKDYKKTTFMYVIVWSIESIGDEYYHLAEFLSKNADAKTKISKEAVTLYNDVNGMFSEFYKAFYSGDKDKLVAINEVRQKVEKKIRDLYKNKNDKEIVLLEYLGNIAQRINDVLGSTISLTLD